MKHEDTEAWYRQFWPWFIMALPGAAVIAGLFTVWLSMQSVDSLVIRTDDLSNSVNAQYKEAEQEARRLSISATIDMNTETGAVSVTVSSLPLEDSPKSLLLTMRHATIASRDSSIELARSIPTKDGLPTFSGHFVNPPTGRHYLTLSAGERWRLTSPWSGQTSIRVDAGH